MTHLRPHEKCPTCRRQDGTHASGCPFKRRYYTEAAIAVLLLALIAVLVALAVTGWHL